MLILHNRLVLTAAEKAAGNRVLDSGMVAQGEEVAAFERELAERFRPDGDCVCVSSGTAALKLAGTQLGESNSVPTYACVALLQAMASRYEWDGLLNVRLVDCEPETFNSPGAGIVVHTYGVPCAVPAGAIEDFTHAPGASLDGKPCGSLGELSVISFGATKPLGCGSGGAVLGPKEAIAEIRDVRDYDQKPTLRARFNYAWHDLGAAIGRERLRRLDEDNAWRGRAASRYRVARACDQAYVEGRIFYRYVVRSFDPEADMARFAAAGIETIVPLRTDELLHRQLGLDPARFPNAEAIAASTVSLPIWPGMTDEMVSRVCDVLATLEGE